MRPAFVSCLLAIGSVLGGCKEQEQPAQDTAPVAPSVTPTAVAPSPAPPDAPREAAKPKATGVGQGTAELTLSGDIAQELKGPIVTCGYTRLDGREQGGTWAIRTDDFDFQIMATSDAELAAPAAVLNVKKPKRTSYVFKRKAGKVTAASDRTVAEIDADLHNVVGKEKVHVKGRMTCPAKP